MKITKRINHLLTDTQVYLFFYLLTSYYSWEWRWTDKWMMNDVGLCWILDGAEDDRGCYEGVYYE